MEIDLSDRVAIVTGAASGIGEATCAALLDAGAAVLAVDVSPTVADVAQRFGGGPARIAAFEADVAEEGSAEAYVAEAERVFGGVDLFFNNAGILGPSQPWSGTPVEAFDRVMRINVRGAWLGLRAVLPAIARRGGGAVVNACSMGSLVGFADASSYIASKHALLGLTRVAAIEGARDAIRVNAVCPGLIATAMGQEVATLHGDDWTAYVERSTPMGRVGTPGEVADAVCYLLSDRAAYVNGAILSVDGGYVASG